MNKSLIIPAALMAGEGSEFFSGSHPYIDGMDFQRFGNCHCLHPQCLVMEVEAFSETLEIHSTLIRLTAQNISLNKLFSRFLVNICTGSSEWKGKRNRFILMAESVLVSLLCRREAAQHFYVSPSL
jgi:hypothetical protein